MSVATQVYLKVDAAKVVKNTPQMFVSFNEACTEAVQNAYRAGASRMEVMLDRDAAVVEIRDDGPGIKDPESLLTIGRSDWERDVVEPAGMGFMALAGLSDEITVESRTADGRAWRLTIPSEAFDGGAAALEDLEPDGTHGVLIRAELDPKRAVLKLSDDFRQRYPLDVRLTVVNNREETVRDLPVVPEVRVGTVETPAGRLISGVGERGLCFVWEYRELTTENGMHDMLDALQQIPDGKHVHDLIRGFSGSFALELRPESGVRPQLPDRRAVIRDQAYHRAVQDVAMSLVQVLDVAGIRQRVGALGLPDILRPRDLPGKDLRIKAAAEVHPLLARHHGVLDVVLRICGYRRVDWDVLSSMSFWQNDDEHGLEFGTEVVWAKTPLLTKDHVLAEALSRSGLLVAYDADAGTIGVRASGTTMTTDDSLPRFGVARAIEVVAEDGTVVGSVNRLVSAEPLVVECNGEEVEGPICLQVAEPADALRTIRHSDDVVGCVMKALDGGYCEGGDFWKYVEGEDILEVQVMDDVVTAFTRDVVPEAHRAETRYMAVRAAADSLRALASEARSTMSRLNQTAESFPETADGLREKIATLDALLPVLELETKKWRPDQ